MERCTLGVSIPRVGTGGSSPSAWETSFTKLFSGYFQEISVLAEKLTFSQAFWSIDILILFTPSSSLERFCIGRVVMNWDTSYKYIYLISFDIIRIDDCGRKEYGMLRSYKYIYSWFTGRLKDNTL